MTHQNHQTNGASLEDCHTNFFALTDLCGIKWRKLVYVYGERSQPSGDPLDDPVLRSYSKCLAVEILCVWRRVAAPKPEPDLGLFDNISLSGPGSGQAVTHPPLALTAAKELWIFWYGEEPNLTDLIAPELLKSPDGAQGAWESGLSYECRTLLFKALHNLIERCLLSRNVIRLGKWFVQPSPMRGRISEKSVSDHLSFCFTFFLHGDSTVCASMDIREHPPIYSLSMDYLNEAAAASSVSALSNCQLANKLNGHQSLDSSQGQPKKHKPVTVILAPYGISATLTGISYRLTDSMTQKLIDDWCAFYPLNSVLMTDSLGDLPPVVEVISNGIKMLYPSKYVLVTTLDDDLDENVKPESSTSEKRGDNHTSENNNSIGVSELIPAKLSNADSSKILTDNRSLHCFGNPVSMHLPPSIATTMPEKVWQECIMHPILENSDSQLKRSSSANENELIQWCFADLLQKETCTCIKCRKQSGGGGRNSSTSTGSSGNNGSSAAGASSSGSRTSSRSERSSRQTRIPFHKRRVSGYHLTKLRNHNICGTNTSVSSNGNDRDKKGGNNTSIDSTSNSSVSSTSSTATVSTATVSPKNSMVNSSPATGATAGTTSKLSTTASDLNEFDVNSVAPSSTLPTTTLPPATQRLFGSNNQNQNGSSSYHRLGQLLDSGHNVGSVGSPASAVASPHPNSNSAISQPSSVPPTDQLLSIKSPHKSVASITPGTPIIDQLDKNTPVATPTDQHDTNNKSAVSSPYVGTMAPLSVDSQQIQQNNMLDQPSIKSDLLNSTVSANNISSSVNNKNSNSNSGSSNINSNSSINNVNSSGVNSSGINNVNSSGNCGQQQLQSTNNLNQFMALLKRPQLMNSQDYQQYADDDFMSHQMLYDYTSCEAWLNHPIKRSKLSDVKSKTESYGRHRDIYAGQNQTSTSQYLQQNRLLSTIKSEDGINQSVLSPVSKLSDYSGCTGDNEVDSNVNQNLLLNIKTESLDDYDGIPPNSSGDHKDSHDSSSKVDFTKSKDLMVSPFNIYKDLEQIFDNDYENSGDDTIQVHTPPGSNKSMGSIGMDDNKRNICNSIHTIGSIRPEELVKMFPTPPSLEHHPNASPCGGTMAEQQNDLLMSNVDTPNLGSPIEEPIDDWNYVFVPPQVCKMVSSSRYAPLTNLPSQSLPQIIMPPNSVYKPSWEQQQSSSQKHSEKLKMAQNLHQQQQHQQQHQQQQLQQPSTPIPLCAQSPALPNNQQQRMNSMQQTNRNMNNMSPMVNMQQSMLATQLARPSPVLNQFPMQMNQTIGPGSCSPLGMNNMPSFMNRPNSNPQMQMMGGMGIRPIISPISPASCGPYTAPGSVGSGMMGSPMGMNPYRRTPLPPPPPYEMAISSPANSTASSSYVMKQAIWEEPSYSTFSRVPEANSLLVNILLYDSALNIFKDHNFESCTLCVCTAGGKCFGNIRGSDSGVYLPLPGTSFHPASKNPEPLHHNQPGANYPYDPNGSNQLNTIGYQDDDPINCQCGFSALVNRRRAYQSGLFYEDELEITGMAKDPVEFKKSSVFVNLRKQLKNMNDKNKSDIVENDFDKNDLISQMLMDVLRDQCAVIQNSASSIQRAIRRCRTLEISCATKSVINILEYTDANDVISLALEQGRGAFEQSMGNRLGLGVPDSMKLVQKRNSFSVHKWPFVKANGPRSNQDIIRIMKSIEPLLQDAFHKNCAQYTVKGPLTWRQFHLKAGRGTGQCEPQPIPSVIVGHDRDWLSVAPYALHYWDKLLLEPYSYQRDIAYVVIAPDCDFIVNQVKMYFKELSTTYDMCKLGRHTPIKRWDGILRVGKPKSNANTPDDWFKSLGSASLSEMIHAYMNACKTILIPHLMKASTDKTLLDPPDSMNSSMNYNMNKDRSLPSPMLPPSTPESSHINEKAPSTPKSSETNSMDDQKDTTQTPPLSEPIGTGDDEPRPCVVIYLIDPITCGSDSLELQRIACLAFLRCYANILASLPDSIKNIVSFQIISLESIMELGRSRDRIRFSDEMRCLALSVFSQCRRYLIHQSNVKSLTGFGTAANMELFLKSKDEKNRAAYRLYTPPYILAKQHEKKEKTESFGTTVAEQQCSILYCSYCLSEDQRWLLAVATDERGELLETITINIDVPNRRRRKKASARRYGLQKLMDFILGVISQSVQSWRLVIGRLGRIGHGELKGWSWLLSKQNLLKVSKQLKDICAQCSLPYNHSVPTILSACLVTLEPDSNLRVMHDQFTPDERFSQIFLKTPLSTPNDVTCTHILVFPTSAVTHSSQTNFSNIIDEDIFLVDTGPDDDEEMGDIFMWEHIPASPGSISRPGSANCLEEGRSRQSPGPGGNSNSGQNHITDAEDIGQLLQQPLALGYLVSTAPTGKMPGWFWASCPHLEDVCPVFLRTALHMHCAAIQQNSDELLQQNQSSAADHPLDSGFTADVLRYVLEGYNVLSWLAMDSNTHDRLSCLPIHIQVLVQLYHMSAAIA